MDIKVFSGTVNRENNILDGNFNDNPEITQAGVKVRNKMENTWYGIYGINRSANGGGVEDVIELPEVGKLNTIYHIKGTSDIYIYEEPEDYNFDYNTPLSWKTHYTDEDLQPLREHYSDSMNEGLLLFTTSDGVAMWGVMIQAMIEEDPDTHARYGIEMIEVVNMNNNDEIYAYVVKNDLQDIMPFPVGDWYLVTVTQDTPLFTKCMPPKITLYEEGEYGVSFEALSGLFGVTSGWVKLGSEDNSVIPQTILINPELTGDEAEFEGIQIGFEKYKLPKLDPELMQQVTRNELLNLITSHNLIPGKQYRMTDYFAYAKSNATERHQFDIVLTADSPSVLNHNARAMKHDGDTYFKDCNLESWILKYDILGLMTDWAAGHGAIYYMQDEWNNIAYYDFKNIKFTDRTESGFSKPNRYTFDYNGQDGSVVKPQSFFNNTIELYSVYSQCLGLNSNIFKEYAWNNHIGKYSGNNVFNAVYGITTGTEFSGNTLQRVHYSTFGHHCQQNNIQKAEKISFNNNCINIEINSPSWTSILIQLGNDCMDMHLYNVDGLTCGNYCHNINIGNSSSSGQVIAVTLGDFCDGVNIGAGSYAVTMDNWSNNITIGNNCHYLRFIGENSDHTFGNNVSYTTITSSIGCNIFDSTIDCTINQCYRGITIKQGCGYINIDSSDTITVEPNSNMITVRPGCYNINILPYSNRISFQGDNKNITFSIEDPSTINSNNRIQHIMFEFGYGDKTVEVTPGNEVPIAFRI